MSDNVTDLGSAAATTTEVPAKKPRIIEPEAATLGELEDARGIQRKRDDHDEDEKKRGGPEAAPATTTATDPPDPTRMHDRKDCPVHAFEDEQAESCLLRCPGCQCFLCDIPSLECPEWRVHCRATRESPHWKLWLQDRQKKRRDPSARPFGAPEGLFDYAAEAQRLASANGRSEALKERAKQTKYYYDDKETLLMAVELYNLSNKVYRERHCCGGQRLELWDATRVFECRKVLGHHTVPCDECGDNNFRKEHGDYYFVDKWGTSKLCAGCMGRNVCFLYGTDPADIANRLVAILDMQQRTKRVVEPR